MGNRILEEDAATWDTWISDLTREYKRVLSIMGNLMCGFIHISFYNIHTELNVCVMSRISVHYHNSIMLKQCLCQDENIY